MARHGSVGLAWQHAINRHHRGLHLVMSLAEAALLLRTVSTVGAHGGRHIVRFKDMANRNPDFYGLIGTHLRKRIAVT